MTLNLLVRKYIYDAPLSKTVPKLLLIDMVYACSLLLQIPSTYPTLQALGWFCASFLVFNTYMLLCSLLMSKAVTMVFVTLELTLLCLTIGYLQNEAGGGGENWTVVGGYLGIATAIAGNVLPSYARILGFYEWRGSTWEQLLVGRKVHGNH